jgi:hypothetical protein
MHEHRALKPRPTGGVLIPPRGRQSMDTKKLPIRLREGELLNGARGGNAFARSGCADVQKSSSGFLERVGS